MVLTEAQKEANRIAAKVYYNKNKAKILKKRRIKDMTASGDRKIAVRVKTINTYGLQDLAKKHGYDTEDPMVTNYMPPLDQEVVVTEEFAKLRQRIEKKLSEYDEAISQMVDTKFKDAQNVYEGKLRIPETEKLTWSSLSTYIDQIPSSKDNPEAGISSKTKKAYHGAYRAMLSKKMLDCDPDGDVVACFNDPGVIDRIKASGPTDFTYTDSKGKAQVGKGTYKGIGSFFTLPISLHRRVPEFRSRFTRFNEYKRASDIYKIYKTTKDEAKKKEPAQNWKIFEKARDFLKEEVGEHEAGYWYDESVEGERKFRSPTGPDKVEKARASPTAVLNKVILMEQKVKHPRTRRNYVEAYRYYVIMCLYTLIPPLRNDFGCVKLTDKPRAETDRENNYYYPKEGWFYLNIFKTQGNFFQSVKAKIEFPDDLKEVVNNWIRVSGATDYLFTKVNSPDPYAGCDEERTTASGFGQVVVKALSSYITRKEKGEANITINVLRHSYVSKIHATKGITTDDLEKVATKMRHSIQTAISLYKRDEIYEYGEHDTDMDEGDGEGDAVELSEYDKVVPKLQLIPQLRPKSKRIKKKTKLFGE